MGSRFGAHETISVCGAYIFCIFYKRSSPMKAALAITAVLLTVSSFAFAGKNNDNGGRSGPFDNPAAADPSDRFDPPDEITVKYCKAARIKDANCRHALSR